MLTQKMIKIKKLVKSCHKHLLLIIHHHKMKNSNLFQNN